MIKNSYLKKHFSCEQGKINLFRGNKLDFQIPPMSEVKKNSGVKVIEATDLS